MFKFAAFLLSFMIPISAYAESFVAKVSRNSIPLGETFTLTLQYDGAPGNSEPDLSPLNQDFNIHSVGRSAQHRNINGVTSNIYQWNVLLSPKKTSQITIPAISFKSFSSSPIKITVSNTSAPGTSAPKFSIGRTIDNHSPLVQEQIVYTLLIKTTEEIRADIPQFVDNGNRDWIIKQIGNPVVSSDYDNGIEVRNININYTLFPQKSGKLKIPELQFNGYYIDSSKFKHGSFSNSFSSFLDDNFFSGFGVTPALTPIVLTAQPITVDVLPIPTDNNGHWWLPSTKVEIISDWDNAQPQFKVGEAVNRKIKLTAFGVADTQLPKLSFSETPALKQYPDNPEYKSIVLDQGIVSEMSVNVVYIPQQGGRITIPAIEVPWYNTTAKRIEKAVLPAFDVDVAGTSPTVALKAEPNANITDNTSAPTETEENITDNKTIPIKTIIALIAMAFLLGLLVSWLLLHFYRQTKSLPSKTDSFTPKSDISKILHSSNLKDVRDEILFWARDCFPNRKILNLGDITMLFSDEELTRLLQQLGANLYSGQNNKFDNKELYNVIKRLNKKQEKQQKQKPLLPELYK